MIFAENLFHRWGSYFILYILSSCSNNESQFERNKINNDCVFDSITNIKTCTTYFNTNDIMAIKQLVNDTLEGKYFEFYKSGIKKVKGTYNKGEKFASFHYYNENGDLSKYEEYIPDFMNGDTITLNQIINFKDNEIDTSNSIFYSVDMPDSVKLGEPFSVKVKLASPLSYEKCEIALNIQEILPYVKLYKQKVENCTVEYHCPGINKKGDYSLYGYIDDYKDTIVNGREAIFTKRLIVMKEIKIIE